MHTLLLWPYFIAMAPADGTATMALCAMQMALMLWRCHGTDMLSHVDALPWASVALPLRCVLCAFMALPWASYVLGN